MKHNPNGPTIIHYDENGNKEYEEFWLNGKKVIDNQVI